MDAAGRFCCLGTLRGHSDWVTSLATPLDSSDTLISASRDKSVLVWKLTREADGMVTGVPRRSLVGHSNFIEDVVLSSDGQFALTGSWDASLRLWDLHSGQTTRRFKGHTRDVLSVAFSPDNRQIVSGSRDNSIRVWNTLGECKFTLTDDGHTDWVSTVRFSPNAQTPLIVSGGWDKAVKVWSLTNLKLLTNLMGHTGYVSTVTISPDGSLCASGGKDGTAMLWDLGKGEHLYELEGGGTINSLVFSPCRYWLCGATQSSIKIWDLESKTVVAELVPETQMLSRRATKPQCVALQWSADGNTLFSAYTDSTIRVWGVQ
eukprot:NODE_2723_length_1134_cov_331.175115_g2442_i1.p1 GENE.NODE_2723_length_1134_cov_331.175115_g2442_i1~~NODE_2723_length_1134_cov_331.175115_g2442_i1.p1  ORF type:complete len:333 (+),score=72.02 NODE_2723_length_1134_cov_331.175115_g2442_i1:48-1001(+)